MAEKTSHDPTNGPSPEVVSKDSSVDVQDAGKNPEKSKCGCNCLKKVSNGIIRGMEFCFYKAGCGIGRYPWVTMIACVVFALIMLPGILFYFNEETAQNNLFVPNNVKALDDQDFVLRNFPSDYRFELMIIEADDVLTPQGVQTMLDIDLAIKSISKTGAGAYNWESVCARRGPGCWSSSLLELWSFDATTIRSLTRADILNTVNTATTSPVYSNPYDVETVLGEISRDANGDISGAKATTMIWALAQNASISFGDTPAYVEEWEQDYLDIASSDYQNVKQVYYFSGRSFGDEVGNSIGSDVLFLSTGYILVIVFVAIVLGRFSHVHQRIYVTVGAVVCIGLAILVSYGFCSYIGLFYGPVHSILPFLFLGIGIDDAFVICQSLDNLGPDRKKMPLEERIGQTLKHAGVSITVTSLTDILAFAVGSTTVLPALRSFCGYAAVGIFAVYLFQATFLVACLTYDEKRSDSDRNACCCCYVHREYQPNACTEKAVVQKVFDKFYAPLMVKLPMKIVVLVLTFGLLGVCIWGTVNLEQDFDFTWFLPGDSYARQYFEASDKYFPQSGVTANVYYSSNIDYYRDYDQLEALHLALRDNEYISASSVDSWYYSYRQWLQASTDPAVTSQLNADKFPNSETSFYSLLNTFMFTAPFTGARFAADVKFTGSSPVRVQVSRSSFQYINLADAATEVKAMDSTRATIAQFNFDPQQLFAFSANYLDFETKKVIQEELYRNLGLAFLCVFLMTLVLLANIWACLLVCLCVIMSLVDVGGCMYFWGLTIDTVTSINLIVAIGLTVDYSAHIAHTFMVTPGDRNGRTVHTLSTIGPAVFYGGFSTFLAFALLAASQSYVFTVFFKVFFLVVLFGMFHGLMFMPVILSWIGPSAYSSAGKHPTSGSTSDKPVENGTQLSTKPSAETQGHDNAALDMQSETSLSQSPTKRSLTPVDT